MGSAIAGSLPYALAAATSPFPITAVILLLLGGRGGARSLSLAGGRVAGYAAVLTCVIVASDLIAATSETGLALAATIARPVVGAITLGVGLWTWWQGTRRGSGNGLADRMKLLDRMTPTTSAGIGLALAVAPATLLMLMGAGLAIVRNVSTPWQEAAGGVIFLALANSTVLLPIVLYYAAGGRARPALRVIQLWLEAHAVPFTAAALGLVGAFLLGSGILELVRGLA